MNAFDQLVSQLSPRRRLASPAVAAPSTHGPGGGTKTQTMRRYLQCHGPANSVTLALEAELENTGLVSALLKGDIERGSVYRHGDKWAWNDEWSAAREQALRDAAALLRHAGYVVKPPPRPAF
jgi:hypothetical protein